MQRDFNNKNIYNIEYVILQCHVNCNFYEITQIAVYLHCVLLVFKLRTLMPEDSRITETCNSVGYNKLLSLTVNI